jgi:hypothetical protein
MPAGRPKKVAVAFALPPRQALAVDAGRQALVEAIENMAPPDKVPPLVGVAVTLMFADFLGAADTAGQILALINSVLEPAGLEIVEHRHRG